MPKPSNRDFFHQIEIENAITEKLRELTRTQPSATLETAIQIQGLRTQVLYTLLGETAEK